LPWKQPPFFYFHGNRGKICPTDSIFFWAYLVPLDVDVTGNITAKIFGVWSEFNIFWRVDKIQNVVTMETEVPK
jgi:hypothetical protein